MEMGGEGFISSMITSLKKNNSALRKPSIFKNTNLNPHSSKKKNLVVSEETKLKLIEEGRKIRNIQVQKRKIYLWTALFLLISICTFLVLLIRNW